MWPAQWTIPLNLYLCFDRASLPLNYTKIESRSEWHRWKSIWLPLESSLLPRFDKLQLTSYSVRNIFLFCPSWFKDWHVKKSVLYNYFLYKENRSDSHSQKRLRIVHAHTRNTNKNIAWEWQGPSQWIICHVIWKKNTLIKQDVREIRLGEWTFR